MSTFIGQPTPADSPATSPADSETTPTRSKNSSPNSAQRSGAHSQRSPATRHDHASYLAHWVRVLKEHPRVLLTVAARAQAALDYLNQLAGVTTAAATADAA